MAICLERGADLHTAQPTATHCLCFSKVQIDFTFLVPAHPGSPGKRAVKLVCVHTRSASTRKVNLIWILLKQETMSDDGISWAICKSAPRSRQTTTPALHHSSFLQDGSPSCRSSNSVKALKVLRMHYNKPKTHWGRMLLAADLLLGVEVLRVVESFAVVSGRGCRPMFLDPLQLTVGVKLQLMPTQ